MDAPVAQFVCVGQSGAAHLGAKAHGINLVGLRVQTCLDVPQTLAIGQLRKSHGAILLGTTEPAHTMVAAITGDAASKRSPGNAIHQLRKQQLARVHRRLQRESLESASRQFQIDPAQKQRQLYAAQRVAENKPDVNRTAVALGAKNKDAPRVGHPVLVGWRGQLGIAVSHPGSHENGPSGTYG
jgi:hypothetical protein